MVAHGGVVQDLYVTNRAPSPSPFLLRYLHRFVAKNFRSMKTYISHIWALHTLYMIQVLRN